MSGDERRHRAGRNAMDRFIDGIEWLAAASSASSRSTSSSRVLLRYFFTVSIPDSYDFGKLLLGILIFWGIAATSYRGRPHHRRSGLVGGGPARQAADRHLRHAGAAVRRHGADRDAVRQGAADLRSDHVLTYDLQHADLAVLRWSPGWATSRPCC